MTLQSTPPITLQQIYTEFAAPLNTKLTAMVRGGQYVGSTNTGVPTAPPINLLHFLGASNAASLPLAHIEYVNETSYATSPADSSCNVQLKSDGNCTVSYNGGPPTVLYRWIDTGAVGDFEFMAHDLTGNTSSLTGSPFNTWISGASGLSWTVTNTSNSQGFRAVSFTVDLRRKSDGALMEGDGTFMIEADVT